METLDKILAASFMMLIICMLLVFPAQLIFNGMPILLLLLAFLFISLVLCYGLGWQYVAKAVFIGYFCVFIAFLVLCQLNFDAITPLLLFFVSIAIVVVLYFIIFWLLSVGFSYIYDFNKLGKGLVVLAIVLLLLLFYYSSGIFHIKFLVNDEVFIMFKAFAEVLAGLNPYAISLAHNIYLLQITNKTSFTLLPNNMLVGTLNYPSLYFLTLFPFYFLSSPTLANYQSIIIPTQAAIYIFLFLVATYYVIDKENILKPKFVLWFFMLLLLSQTVSIITFLMIVVMILATVKLKSSYSWILLGLAVCMQELLWFPALLLIAYAFNTYGIKKGVVSLSGTVLVFLIFNIYFIIQSPQAFISSVFTPLTGNLPYDSSSPIGYFIFIHLGIMPSLLSELFVLGMVFAFILSLYFNNKKVIPLLSIIPFLFLGHSLIYYYYFFIVMFVILVYSEKEEQEEGFFKSIMHPINLLLIITVLMVAGMIAISGSHKAFTSTLNLQPISQVAYISNNVLYYNVTMKYNASASQNMSILLDGYGRTLIGFWGLFNTSILPDSVACNYPCNININHIYLNSSSHTIRIDTVTRDFNNETYMSLFLYNDNYSYNTQMIKVTDR